jgi:hypothetical protein
MSTETVMFFWLIHLFIGIVIPALIYCDGCQMSEEAKPKVALPGENAGIQQSATDIRVSYVETIPMRKGES